jgi:hypothetical protein
VGSSEQSVVTVPIGHFYVRYLEEGCTYWPLHVTVYIYIYLSLPLKKKKNSIIKDLK